jgi:Ca2+-binding EF-hand superfamily protein
MNERQVFDAIDDDGDGKLDRAEFNMAAAFLGAALRRLNTAEELDEIFTVIDLDQTGEVS